MANAVWPAGLPQAPLVAQLVESFPDEVIRTPMEVGPAKVRRRLAAGVTPVQVELALSRSQAATFRAFFRDACESGALPFEWKDHRTGDTVIYRFVGVPDVRPSAPRQDGSEPWTATFNLELLPAGFADGGGGGGGGGGGTDFAAGGGSDLLTVGEQDGSGGGRGDAGDEQQEAWFMPVFFEADEPAPAFLLDALQVIEADAGLESGDAGHFDGPFFGGGDGSQHGGVPQHGNIVVPQ